MKTTFQDETVTAEQYHALVQEHGTPAMPFRTWVAAFAELGYKVQIRDYCDCNAHVLTGPLTGLSHPNRSYELTHVASGLSAYHVDAPKDNWDAVKELRNVSVLNLRRTKIVCV